MFSTLADLQDRAIRPYEREEMFVKCCPECASVLQGDDDTCVKCGKTWGDTALRAKKLSGLLASMFNGCTCGKRTCAECCEPNGIFCGDCGQPCGMAFDGSQSVVSGCHGAPLYRNRALTVEFEHSDALHEIMQEDEAVRDEVSAQTYAERHERS